MDAKAVKASTRRSVTGIWIEHLPRSARGFSLLELLIVVTIIGIFIGAAVLSIGVLGRDREMEREMLRLSSLLELMREEALMQGRDYGLLITRSGYRFYIYDYMQQQWVEPAHDNLMRPRHLPDGLSLELAMEGRDLVLRPDFEIGAPDVPQPQIALFSSGEVTPFRVSVQRGFDPGRMTLDVALDGTMESSEDGFATP
jgi:general secretion pathway protein H